MRKIFEMVVMLMLAAFVGDKCARFIGIENIYGIHMICICMFFIIEVISVYISFLIELRQVKKQLSETLEKYIKQENKHDK